MEMSKMVNIKNNSIEVTKEMKLRAFKGLYKNLTPEQRRAVPIVKAQIEKLEKSLGYKKKPTLIDTLQTILNIKKN